MVALMLDARVGVAQTASQPTSLDAAKKQMERGQELYMQQKYEEAAAAFAAAYTIQPYGAFLYNEGVCHQKIGNNDKALAIFRKYLAADPGAPDAEQVRHRIQRLEQATQPLDADAGPVDADSPSSIVEEAGPDLMKSLVMIESEPPSAPVSVYYRTVPSASPFQYGQDNPGWQRVATGQTPFHASLQLGRYHIVLEPFADFQKSETDIDVAEGHVHQFKANLQQGEFLAFLRVTTPMPGARIYVDDPPPHKKPPWGRTPHEGLIGVGDHTIWIVKNGFETASRAFSVKHGEEREELVELIRGSKGTLHISGNASPIHVSVDGIPVGTFHPNSAITIELPAGKHEITATADDRKDLVGQVDVPRGQVVPIDLVMVPTTPRGAAWTQAIVSAVFVGGGIALKVQSDIVYDDIHTAKTNGSLTESDERYTKGKIYAYGSAACFGVGGTLALLSTYNFIKDPTPSSAIRVGVPHDYPDSDTAPPRLSAPRSPAPAGKTAPRTTSPVAPPALAIVPSYPWQGVGLMLQGRF